MPELDLFTETAAVLVVALLFSVVSASLRQPLIVAYIFTGVLVGPAGFGWVVGNDPLDLLAQMGIALLLFVVGLKLDPRLIRTLGKVVLAITLVQVALVTVLGLGLALLLGMDPITALYVGLGLSFSSTVVIVKLLSDSQEINALHGRIALGMLIVQDLVVVLCMVLLTAFDGSGSAMIELLLLPLKGFALLGAVGLVMRYCMPSLLRRFARSQELLMLAATAWAVFLSAAGHALGFSHEVGAFVAGMSLAATPFHDAIGARLTALRDFLLLFFFVDLGAHVNLTHLNDIWLPTLLLVAVPVPPAALRLDGCNVLPVLRGEKGKVITRRFWQWNRYTPLVTCNAAMRDGPWKLVRPAIREAMTVSRQDLEMDRALKYEPAKFDDILHGPEPEREVPPPPPPQLVNIDSDPLERNDLASSEPSRTAKMLCELENWFETVEAERKRIYEKEQRGI